MLSEAGFDKGAKLKPINNGLEIIHEYLDLKGEPVSKVAVGDEFLVRLRLRATDRDQVQQVAVVDLLPGGVEPVYNLPPEPETASADESEGDDSEYVETADGDEADAWQAPIGLEVGQSVRSVDECAEEARADLTVITNLMESRTIAGPERLRQRMLEVTDRKSVV